MSDTILRQIEMLRLIPRHGKISPQQLQRRLEDLGYVTTERTVQRDLLALSRLFSLECDNSSKPHGWRWGKDMVACDLAGLSIPEALAFRMLEQFGTGLLPAFVSDQLRPYFAAARRQLDLDVGPRSMRNWTRRVRAVTPNQPLLTARVPDDIMHAIHAALMQECCLQLRYRNGDGPTHLVHPLGLVQHGPTFYLVVNFDGFSDVRLLAVQRIREAQLVTRKIRPPEGFDLDAFIADGAMGFGELGTPIRLHIRMYNHAGEHLKETRLSEDQVVQDIAPGETEIKATVQLTRRLRWWLLGFGGDVEVIQPASLRREMQQHLEKASARYRT